MREWILILLLGTGIFFVYHKKERPVTSLVSSSTLIISQQHQQPLIIDIVHWPAVRQAEKNIGLVLADIDSHMSIGHHFRDKNKITWAHETTHGINNEIRNKHLGSNGFYVLEDRAIVVLEPRTTIARVALNVPKGWRGLCHDLYLIQQRRDWNNQPLYLCDEWVAYTNGAACRKDLQILDQESEMEFTCEFTGYVLCLAYTIKQDCPDYDDKQFRAFVMWSIERTMKIYANESGANKRLEAIRGSSDGEVIRQFARSYFGVEWCRVVLGF